MFREEVAEHAQTVDDILLRADEHEPDRDQLDALFRAVHSIKGGCGTFGFPRLGAFAHVLEELLDAVRGRELPLDLEISDTILRGNELIRALLAAECGEGVVETSEAERVTDAISAALQRRSAPPPPDAPRECRWLIRLHVADPARREHVIESMRAAFETLGSLEVLDREGDVWRAAVRCTRSAAELRDLYAFLGAADDDFSVVAAEEAVPAAFGFFDDEPATAPIVSAGPVAPADTSSVAGSGTNPTSRGTIRVGTERIDHLVNLVGELVIAQSMLERAAETLGGHERESIDAAVAQIQRHTRDLRDGVMSIRMVPLASVFGRFRRVCHELEERLGKRVALRISGEETELDKGMIERLVDPLTHLLRNALDHGVETPAEREAAGKSPIASVRLAASHRGGEVVIEVADDGRGLDRAAIIARARERGVPVDEAAPDDDVWSLIFASGFSTARNITDVSGRGVGMDVVHRNVTELGGRIEIGSVFGAGTTIRIHLPLTLAIIDGLSVRVGAEEYVVPLTAIVESLQPAPGSRLRIGSGEVLAFRGDYVPIIPLRDRFPAAAAAVSDEDGSERICVVVESATRRAALEVDALESQLQVVVKSLETNFRPVPGIAGATVLGSGRVALILDVAGLLGSVA
jgi:two-component system chemotaxis sensor kinase CheA